jgi:hypothetical protein
MASPSFMAPRQAPGLGLDLLSVFAFECRLQFAERPRWRWTCPLRKPCRRSSFIDFSVEWIRLRRGSSPRQALALLVFLGVGLGVLDHLLDLVVGQAARCLDADLLLLAGALVLGGLTLTMPLASMSKVTSICGTPRGAGGMPIRSNWPSILLSAAISRSPWKTRMVTAVWLSSAVEKVWLFLVGIVVLRSISG